MNKSFTLIEILVVIVVIGILSAFILVGMNSISNSANIAKGQAFANSVRNSLLINLVSEWKLDGNGNDSWGTNNGTWSGTTVPNTLANYRPASECVSGQCLDFDGADDIVDCGNNSTLSMGTRDHTVSFWVNFDNATAPQYEVLIGCGCSSWIVGQDGYWVYRSINNNHLSSIFTDGLAVPIGGTLSAPGTLVANTWYNIVVVFDRDATAYAYINSKLQTGYSSDIHLQNTDVANTTTFKIGAYPSPSYRFAGRMDDVKIYHAIVSSFQINENYYSGINKLFKNNGIALDEFNQRLVELKSDIANNE